MTDPTHEFRVRHYLKVAECFCSQNRRVPGTILGMLAKSVRVWKDWPNIPLPVRQATDTYWRVAQRSKP